MNNLVKQQIEIDTHTHTVISGHAWSTLTENCQQAARIGMKGLCLTEHGPAMEASLSEFGPCSYKMLPKEICGIRVITGLEFNITDFDGSLDVHLPEALENIHFGIASMHDVTMPKGSALQHTDAYCAALENPYVDILGHPGYSFFPNHPEALVQKAKQLDKLIEINNNSFISRADSRDNCIKIARLCKKHGVKVCVSSDSHFWSMIGKTPLAFEMLDEIDFPPELILNLSFAQFEAHLREHGRLP